MAVEIERTTDSTQQSDRVCLVARRMRYGSYVCVSQHGNTVCGMPFRPELIAGPSSIARHARVSDCGPKSPEKEVECAAVVRILGVETLPTNVEPEHAPRTRAVLVEAQLRSAPLWRTRGPHRGSVKQVPRLRARTGHAPCAQAAAFGLFLLCPRTLASPSASVKRAAAVSRTSSRLQRTKHTKPAPGNSSLL